MAHWLKGEVISKPGNYAQGFEPPVSQAKHTHYPTALLPRLLDRRRTRPFSISSARCLELPHTLPPQYIDKVVDSRPLVTPTPLPSLCPYPPLLTQQSPGSLLPSPSLVLWYSLSGKAQLRRFRTLLVLHLFRLSGMRRLWLRASSNASLRIGVRNTVRPPPILNLTFLHLFAKFLNTR